MTHSNIIPFNYHEKEIRVIQDEQGNPWWVAADICDALDLSNPTETLKALDDDEKNTLRISEGIKKGNPNVNIINEPGLYTLIIRSNKPEAKKFKRWITHDVLPSIRKTGAYSMGDYDIPDFKTLPESPIDTKKLQSITKNFQNFKKLAIATGLKGKTAIRSANESMIKFDGIDCIKLIGATHLLERGRSTAISDIDIFIDDCCTLDPGNSHMRLKPRVLFDVYVKWCRETGRSSERMKVFHQVAQERFGSPVPNRGIRTYRGVKLIREGE